MTRNHLFHKLFSLATPTGKITYQLVRSAHRRSMEIRIDDLLGVKVSAPRFTPQEEIHAFLNQKARWIHQKLAQAHERREILTKRRYDNGGEFFFLGQPYPLRLQEAPRQRCRVSFKDNGFQVGIPSDTVQIREGLVKDALQMWYREQAEEIFGGRVFHFARVMGIEPLKIAVKTQKRIWGSCHPRTKTINLNWMLVLAPLKVIDYVVVHELSHLDVPNHSRRFWRRVSGVMPDYQRSVRWLKEHAVDMVMP